MGQADLMLGRGGVDRGRPLLVLTATAGFPRGTDEGSNQLREPPPPPPPPPKKNSLNDSSRTGDFAGQKSGLTSFLFLYNTDRGKVLFRYYNKFNGMCEISGKRKNTRIEPRENTLGWRKSEQTVKRPSSATSEPAPSVPFSSKPAEEAGGKKEALIN